MKHQGSSGTGPASSTPQTSSGQMEPSPTPASYGGEIVVGAASGTPYASTQRTSSGWMTPSPTSASYGGEIVLDAASGNLSTSHASGAGLSEGRLIAELPTLTTSTPKKGE